VALRIGIPHFWLDLLVGVIIGPYALGGIALPVFPEGIFPMGNELYVIALIAAVIFFFVSGLRTNIGLFFRYSLAGGIIGATGALVSFLAGNLAGCLLLNAGFFSPHCLLFGIICMAASSGITARILCKNKKMNSPEGVAILASSVFDNGLGIIAFAFVFLILMVSAGRNLGTNVVNIPLLAGAYSTGLLLSGPKNVALTQERLGRVYDFFVPFLFAIIGMMLNVRDILTLPVLTFGIIYSLVVIIAKIIGGGSPALLLGFNFRGSLRIGTGMIPRGELSLIIAFYGLVQGIIDQQLFAAAILMALITAIAALPLLNISLKLSGPGTRIPVKGDDPVSASWEFSSRKSADLLLNMLIKELRAQGLYIQAISTQNGFFQARKDDIAFSIMQEKNSLVIDAARTDMPFVKNVVFGIINSQQNSIQKPKGTIDTHILNNDTPASGERTGEDIFSLITPDCISVTLKGSTKKEIITELVDILAVRGKLLDRNLVLHDILKREKTMSTGMQNGIALPHAKTEGVNALAIAIGTKKEGMDFESIDGSRIRLIILMVSPQKTSGPHVQFLASISAVLKNDALREAVMNASTPEEVSRLLRTER
jgi:fructose-specific phosphotransferase system IIA component